MTSNLKKYKVSGVIQTLLVPIDINEKVEAYSKKQATFKAFLNIKKKFKFKGFDNKKLYKAVKKLKVIEK